MGIPDSQILLMLPDEYACNPRNPFPAQIFNQGGEATNERFNLYEFPIEVDYRASEVNVESFNRLLTARHTDASSLTRSKQLLTDRHSNILIYMSGHGGDNFFKFQDQEELNSNDLKAIFQTMWQQHRYHSILFILDTCQASTLFDQLNSEETPNIITIGSSRLGENSYSHNNDYTIGLSMIDRFTYYTLDYFEKNNIIANHYASNTGRHVSGLNSKKTIADLVSHTCEHQHWTMQ